MIPPKEHRSYKIAKIVCGKRPAVTKNYRKQMRGAARVLARAASRSKVYFPAENSHWIPGKRDLAARVQARAASRSKVYFPAESSRWIPGKQSVAVVLGGTLTK